MGRKVRALSSIKECYGCGGVGPADLTTRTRYGHSLASAHSECPYPLHASLLPPPQDAVTAVSPSLNMFHYYAILNCGESAGRHPPSAYADARRHLWQPCVG
jgi:hypothetical protein